MKKILLILVAAAFATGLLCQPALEAKPPKPLKPQPTPEYKTTIKSVDANSITIQKPKEVKTYKITQFTEITSNGQTVKIADLKPGMLVEITVGSDPGVAEKISVTGAVAR